MDDEFFEELIQTFILEFEELMDLYKNSLQNIRRNRDKEESYANLFRIYHTLKGDAGYFPEFEHFTKFTSHYCELLRPLDKSVYDNPQLLTQLRLNFTRLSSVLKALKNGKSLQSYRFKLN